MRGIPTFYDYQAQKPKGDGTYGEISFKTNNPELHERITDYIGDLIDAHQWRTRTQPIRIIDDNEEE